LIALIVPLYAFFDKYNAFGMLRATGRATGTDKKGLNILAFYGAVGVSFLKRMRRKCTQGELGTMKVLLFNGSPRAEGNTYIALSEIATVLAHHGIESEIFQLGTDPVRGCLACRKCKTTSKCVFDDVVNRLVEKASQCDGFIFGTPVYYGSANGAMCAVLDRAFYSAAAVFTGKPCASIVVCRRGGAATAFDRLNKYFTINQMPVVTSQYWNAVHGHEPEHVRSDLEGLQIMRVIGYNMAWLLKCIAAGGPPPKAEEKRMVTNFHDGK